MLKPLLAAGMALALGAAPAGAQPQHVNPATGGSGIEPGPTIIGVVRHQASVQRTIGNIVRTSDGKPVGTVADMLLDRQHGVIGIVGLSRTSGAAKGPVVISWSALTTVRGAPGQFLLRLSPSALAHAPSFDAARQQHPDYLDIKKDVIGREVKSTEGATLGTITDLVIERGSGTIDYVAVRSGRGLGAGNAPHAVYWKHVAQLPKVKDRPVVLNVGPQQLAAAPIYGLKAPLRPQAPNPNRVMNQVPPTGNRGD